jgi:hypothetical protein
VCGKFLITRVIGSSTTDPTMWDGDTAGAAVLATVFCCRADSPQFFKVPEVVVGVGLDRVITPHIAASEMRGTFSSGGRGAANSKRLSRRA